MRAGPRATPLEPPLDDPSAAAFDRLGIVDCGSEIEWMERGREMVVAAACRRRERGRADGGVAWLRPPVEWAVAGSTQEAKGSSETRLEIISNHHTINDFLDDGHGKE